MSNFTKVAIDNADIPGYVVQTAAGWAGLDEHSNKTADAIYADVPSASEVKHLKTVLKKYGFKEIQYDLDADPKAEFHQYGHGRPLR